MTIPQTDLALEQLLPVQRRIWEQLQVSPVAKMCELWASWPESVRKQWMAWGRCDTYETPGTPTWMGIHELDRIKILKVMQKVRSIYVASDLTHNWSTIARIIE